MTKLNDTQCVLLAAAAARDNSSLLPFPDSLVDAGARLRKAISALIKDGLAAENEVTEASLVHRTDGDVRYGLFITDAGRVAINVEPEGAGTAAAAKVATASSPADSPPRQTKAALVLELLRRKQGATLAELVEATGWLPHTARAGLTGLRKKGHVIDKTKRGDTTCYRIARA